MSGKRERMVLEEAQGAPWEEELTWAPLATSCLSWCFRFSLPAQEKC